jgi:hypothetical protein
MWEVFNEGTPDEYERELPAESVHLFSSFSRRTHTYRSDFDVPYVICMAELFPYNPEYEGEPEKYTEPG